MLRSLWLRSCVVYRHPSVGCPWARLLPLRKHLGAITTVTPVPLDNEGVFLVRIDGHVTQLVQELAHEKSEVCLERRSFVDAFKLALQSDCVEDTSCNVPLCQAKVCVCTFSQVISLRTSFTFAYCLFRILSEVVSGGTHMESGFYRFCDPLMCMSTASVLSTVRERFDASGQCSHNFRLVKHPSQVL